MATQAPHPPPLVLPAALLTCPPRPGRRYLWRTRRASDLVDRARPTNRRLRRASGLLTGHGRRIGACGGLLVS
eukprot:3255739-Pyramimonas_sp.AAC.1